MGGSIDHQTANSAADVEAGTPRDRWSGFAGVDARLGLPRVVDMTLPSSTLNTSSSPGSQRRRYFRKTVELKRPQVGSGSKPETFAAEFEQLCVAEQGVVCCL